MSLTLAPARECGQRLSMLQTLYELLLIHLHSDFADQHPAALVIGTDLSPIQPTWVPPNLSFEISDCCEEWSYEKDSFDFIHIRGLYGSVADWSAFYVEVYK